MGIFSGKTKKYVGISNGKLIDETKRPRALIDSTTAYINDYGHMKNKNAVSLVDYNLKGMQESIVPAVNRFNRFSDTTKYGVVGKSKSNYINLSLDKINHEVKRYLEAKYNNVVINYIVANNIDYGHFLKQILINDKNYNSSTNIFNDMWYLHDAIIYTKKELPFKYLGVSFTSGKTPFRNKDETRGYTPWIVDNNIVNTYAKVFYIAEGIKTIEVKETTTVIYTIDNEGNRLIQSKESTSNNTIIKDTTTVLANSEYIEMITEDKGTSINTTVNSDTYTEVTIHTYITTKRYKLTKDEKITLPNFYLDESIVPDEIESVDISSSYDKNKLNNFIGLVENNNEVTALSPYMSSPYLILVSYSYGEEKLINYMTITNTNYPEITNNFSDGSAFGQYVSRVYFKIKGTDISDKKYPDWYKASKKAAAKLGIKYDSFYASVKENLENYDAIRSSYINFAINIDGNSLIEHKYIFEFMQRWFEVSTDIVDNFMDGNIHQVKPVVLTWKDNYAEGNLEAELITIGLKQGYIEKSYSRGNDVLLNYNTYYDNSEFIQSYTIKGKVFYKKINDTQYLELVVYELQRNERITNSLWSNGDGKCDLVIPLDFVIINNFFSSFKEKEEIIYKSMYLEFTTYVKVKQKWYQTGVFKAVVFIASVFISVYTGGAGFSLLTVTQAAVTSLVTMYATELIMKAIIKAFNPDLARKLGTLLAIAAIAYGGYGAINVGTSLARATAIFFTRITNLMKLSSMLMQASSIRLNQDLQKEQKDYKAKMKSLEEMKQEILGNEVNSMLSYLDQVDRTYVASNVILGETIDEYIARYLDYRKWETPINYTHEYADYIKQLPTFNETIRKRLNEQQLYVDKEQINED